MCQCTPTTRTPFCGKGDCVWPSQKEKPFTGEIDFLMSDTQPAVIEVKDGLIVGWKPA